MTVSNTELAALIAGLGAAPAAPAAPVLDAAEQTAVANLRAGGFDVEVAGVVEQTGPARCAVTELLTDQCAHCRPAPPAEQDVTGLGPWIAARYRGTCSGCGDRFEEFANIRSDGAGGWLAECCAGRHPASGNVRCGTGVPLSALTPGDRAAVEQFAESLRITPAGPPPSTVAVMRDVLADLDASRPRSMQTALGPSELGTPCQRQIAMKLAGVPRQLPDKRPPWAPMQGTAIHALMEEALRFHNGQLGRERWVIEERLHMDDVISGSGDAFDTDTATVVDWKYVGSTALRKVKRKTLPVEALVSPTYRVQAHLYGYGHARAGRRVEWVRLVLLARSHDYDESAEWTERYQPEIAIRALDRYHATVDLVAALGLANTPALWAAVPASPGDDECAWCPFRRPGGPADGTGCPGNTEQKINKQVTGLIA